MDKDLAYMIGAINSDGCIYFFNNKKRNMIIARLEFTIGAKSMPMLEKVQDVLLEHFKKRTTIQVRNYKNSYALHTSINRHLTAFLSWEDYKIPAEIKSDAYLFGAYLAGLIDGDGYVKTKHNIDRKRPQSVIKIASDRPLEGISTLIQKYAACKVHFEHNKKNKGVQTCFYVTKKNAKFLKDCVLPNLAITHKIEALSNMLKDYEPARI